LATELVGNNRAAERVSKLSRRLWNHDQYLSAGGFNGNLDQATHELLIAFLRQSNPDLRQLARMRTFAEWSCGKSVDLIERRPYVISSAALRRK